MLASGWYDYHTPMMHRILFILFFFLFSCSNDIREVNKMVDKVNKQEETATNVKITYSDSAEVKVRILSPIMKRYYDKSEAYDEFPDGLKVEFLNDQKQVSSWLEADYALRKDKERKIFVEKNVVLYNRQSDKLETDELVWDENAEEVYTSRPVKISQPAKGDTSFGYGFRADQEFTRFEIQRKFSAIKNVDDLTKDL